MSVTTQQVTGPSWAWLLLLPPGEEGHRDGPLGPKRRLQNNGNDNIINTVNSKRKHGGRLIFDLRSSEKSGYLAFSVRLAGAVSDSSLASV